MEVPLKESKDANRLLMLQRALMIAEVMSKFGVRSFAFQELVDRVDQEIGGMCSRTVRRYLNVLVALAVVEQVAGSDSPKKYMWRGFNF